MRYILSIFVMVLFLTPSFVLANDQVPFGSEITSSIKNYNRATPLLATSGALNENAIRELAAKGIKTIINLRTVNEGSIEEGKKATKAGIKYINIPISRNNINNDEILAKFTKAMDSIKEPTLLHCGSGNRVGAMLTRYYISKGMDTDTAFEMGRTAGMKPSLEKVINKEKMQEKIEN